MTKDKLYFKAYLSDLMQKAQNGQVRYTKFLTGEEKAMCELLIKRQMDVEARFYGGYEDAERVVLCLSPEGISAESSDYPIKVLEAALPADSDLSHRDFLGALMAEGVDRGCIGDIIVSYEFMKSYVFVYETVAAAVKDSLNTVGSHRISFNYADSDKLLIPEKTYVDLTFTVNSPRLDAVVSGLIGCSREKAAEIIQTQRIRIRNRDSVKNDTKIEVGDVISIRGFGKFIIDYIGDGGKKGRKRILARKYA